MKPQRLREASKRYWLTDEEVELYGIDREPERGRDYLSLRAFHTRMRYDIADKEQWAFLDNKYIFGLCCKAMNLPHPTVYGVFKSSTGLLVDGGEMRSAADLETWLRRTGRTRFVMKPVSGGGSEGIFLVEDVSWIKDEPVLQVTGHGSVSLPDLCDQLVTNVSWREGLSGVLLQELAIPHPWFDQHALRMLNIVRIVTFVPDDGDPVAQSAILYSGREGDTVNAFKNGALSIHIDLVSGVLGTGRTLPKYGREPLSSHPDTGETFEGLQLPDWQQAVELTLRAARMALGMRLVCWEVLLTDAGPQLLEGNWTFGLGIMQVHGSGFLKDGTAELWKQAGANLPDGSRRWVWRNSQVGQIVRKARSLAAI